MFVCLPSPHFCYVGNSSDICVLTQGKVTERWKSILLYKLWRPARYLVMVVFIPVILYVVNWQFDMPYRYYVAEDWTPKKLEVEVPVPDELNLEQLRGNGPQPGEQLQPEDEPATAATANGGAVAGQGAGPTAGGLPQPAQGIEPDGLIVAQLVSMGLSENGSKRAGG